MRTHHSQKNNAAVSLLFVLPFRLLTRFFCLLASLLSIALFCHILFQSGNFGWCNAVQLMLTCEQFTHILNLIKSHVFPLKKPVVTCRNRAWFSPIQCDVVFIRLTQSHHMESIIIYDVLWALFRRLEAALFFATDYLHVIHWNWGTELRRWEELFSQWIRWCCAVNCAQKKQIWHFLRNHRFISPFFREFRSCIFAGAIVSKSQTPGSLSKNHLRYYGFRYCIKFMRLPNSNLIWQIVHENKYRNIIQYRH